MLFVVRGARRDTPRVDEQLPRAPLRFLRDFPLIRRRTEAAVAQAAQAAALAASKAGAAATPVDGEVNLGGQAAPRAAQRFTVRRRYGDAAGRSPFLRAPAACWWARTTLESTLMIHSTG